jgi:hypothetical protein
VALAPDVDNLAARESETLGYVGSRHKLIHVESPTHRGDATGNLAAGC